MPPAFPRQQLRVADHQHGAGFEDSGEPRQRLGAKSRIEIEQDVAAQHDVEGCDDRLLRRQGRSDEIVLRELNAISKAVDDAYAGAIRSEVTRVEFVGNADGRGGRIDACSRYVERAAVEIGSDHLEAASRP